MGAVNVHLLIKFTQAGRPLILSETSEGWMLSESIVAYLFISAAIGH